MSKEGSIALKDMNKRVMEGLACCSKAYDEDEANWNCLHCPYHYIGSECLRKLLMDALTVQRACEKLLV